MRISAKVKFVIKLIKFPYDADFIKNIPKAISDTKIKLVNNQIIGVVIFVC